MKTKILKIALVAVALFIGGRALAWENIGHAVIAYNAERLLDPEVKAKCRHYLKASIPFYATWMDQVGYSDPYYKEAPGHGNMAVDHTGKLPDNEKRSASLAIERIRKDMKHLDRLNDSTIRVNILYLIHTVADMHCPGHNYIPAAPGTPKVSYRMVKGKKSTRVSFHSFWDNEAYTYKRDRHSAERTVDKLDKLTPKEAKKIVKGTAVKWYYTEMIEAKARALELTPTTGHIDDIPRETRLEMQRLCDEKVVAGGYRLAHILNEIFK